MCNDQPNRKWKKGQEWNIELKGGEWKLSSNDLWEFKFILQYLTRNSTESEEN